MIRSWRFQSTLSRGERRGDAVYANKKRIDHWLKTLSLAGAPNGSLVVDSFNLSRIIPDETDLGKLFQSTLSRGERPMSFSFITLLEIFQSTLSRGERPMSFSFITLLEIFQSTLSRGERPMSFSCITLLEVFQSTLSRGERPCKPPQYYDGLLISIHALTRRAA